MVNMVVGIVFETVNHDITGLSIPSLLLLS